MRHRFSRLRHDPLKRRNKTAAYALTFPLLEPPYDPTSEQSIDESPMSAQHALSLKITGLSCAGCAGRAERALAAAEGVGTAAVNLASASAEVTGSAPLSAEALAGVLADAGYPAAEATVELDLEGLSCATCVARVERALLMVPGVLEASVNLAAGRAHLRFLEGSTDTARLIAAVRDAGYAARAVSDRAEEDAEVARRTVEIAGLRRSTLLAGLLALPVFLIEMGGHMIPALHHWVAANIGMQNSHLFQFALTTAVLIGPGRRFYAKGFLALLRGAPDMNALVALGTSAAYLFSVVATFSPGVLPAGTANVYYEAAAVIVVLILMGRWLEARAKGRTGAAIRRLVGLQVKTALLVRDGVAADVPVAEIRPGDTIRTRPGERFAVDGRVLAGNSYVDESMITGEPVPQAKSAGEEVTAGTVNGNGALDVEALRTGADTALAQIIRMVGQAQGAKLPVQGLVDRITLWFVPAVMAIAVLTVLVWISLGPAPALPLALVAGVSVLIIACPCAMGLATPAAIMAGIGRAAGLGVLFRKGDALQRLEHVRVIALDKTGTLTEGHPKLTSVHCAAGFARGTVLRLAAAAEAQSEHPVARAIVEAAREEAAGTDLPPAEAVEAVPGFGISARVENRSLLAGADRFLKREGVDLRGLDAAAQELAARGETPLFVAVDGEVAALLGVSDPVKPGSREAVEAFHAQGLKVAMLTGDNAGTALSIAAELGIDEVRAGLLPGDKAGVLEELQEDYGPAAFAGDGINDAPALATAEAGIAIGTGTDVAIEAADIVLMTGDLRGVVNALHLSRATMRNIRQNLGWAFGYNILLIPVAAGVLYPFGGPLLSPMLAAGAMALSSVFVVTNALRLSRLRPAAGTAEDRS
jgi:Cu+-exporting ATPase